MKITSTLLAHEKPIIAIEVCDTYDPKSPLIEDKLDIESEPSTTIQSKHLITDGMVILDTQMFFDTAQTISFEISESIVMNFICCNNVKTRIDQLEGEIYSRENTHNILYTSNFNATFQIPSYEPVNYLSIILSLDFYYNLINEDWKLHQNFSKKILEKKSSYLTENYTPFSPAIQWIIYEIKNCNRQGALKKMYIETKIKELLILQLEALTEKVDYKNQIDENDFKKLQEAKLILESNFTHAPNLSELSRMISLNEFKLKKGFKACFDTTVKSYITKLRMEYAKELFKNKAATVSEVAYKCGYKDVSHFSAAFKLFYGLSPQKFKINWDTITLWLSGLLLLG